MKSTENSTDKVYAHAHYTIHYRSARRMRWHSTSRPLYAALFLLEGRLRWSAGEDVARGADTEGAGGGSQTPVAGGELERGGALFVNPGETARVAGERAESLSLSLAPAYVLDCAVRARLTRADARITFRASVVSPLDERLVRLARDLADELLEETTGQELVVAALIEQLVVQLLRRQTNIRRSDELELSRVGLIDRRIRRAVELMHAHLDRDLPLEEIAAAAHLSPFHFARLFKKLTGAAPHAYLAALRAARAQTLLAETDLSIIEVGARVGYSSPSHFAKAFRHAHGLSPRAFRAALVRR
ncbi:MAG TPA: helix-turn-helix domain-containing protein [Pyrinomonadaceae bacterium]|jgi:AraC family transcriptional regulator|nr:helix-turn-helix domain-containing protein [Pyrinomonadaceae bacterium]